MERRNQREVGTEQEGKAVTYLEEYGYEMMDQNYWCRFGELDIVARDGKYLCFIEVKYRESNRYGAPEGVISEAKRKKICITSQFYMKEKRIPVDTPVRYDVVLIVGTEIQLIQNAFCYI